MTSLLLIGNTNLHTFANAILAADRWGATNGGGSLTGVFVVHTPESERAAANDCAWRIHLQNNGVEPSLIVSMMTDLSSDHSSLPTVVEQIQRFLHSITSPDAVAIDLTNGPTLYKNTLATIGYVLGIRHQLMLDPNRAPTNATVPGRPLSGFLDPSVIREYTVKLPDPEHFDRIASLADTEVLRHQDRLRRSLARLHALVLPPNFAVLEREARSAFSTLSRAWRTERAEDFQLGLQALGRAFEHFISEMSGVILGEAADRPQPLEPKIGALRSAISSGLDQRTAQTFHSTASLLRSIRNEATHEVSYSQHVEAIRSRLSIELFLGVLDLVDWVSLAATPLDTSKGVRTEDVESAKFRTIECSTNEELYIGIDGDDTGRHLERLFARSANDTDFRQFSKRVAKAISTIAHDARQPTNNLQVLFSSGDDLLLRGRVATEKLVALKNRYQELTSGLTCSIGFGRTPREAYVALKVAKATAGKNAVVGVELVD